MADSRSAPSVFAAVGWAFYLACSWTWVIGMFLPLLLLRDFGWPGYLAFLLPNAVGAAAMGLVLRRDGASEQFVEKHRPVVWIFSLVTSAFQWFFLAHLLSPPGFSFESIGLMLAAAAAAIAALLASRRDRHAHIASVLAWVISGSLLGWVILQHQAWPTAELLALKGGKPGTDFDVAAYGGLAAVCTLGFALCPYLDRTFHHACQRAGGRRVFAFALGFLVLFALMVIGTLVYARPTALRAIDAADAVIPLRFALLAPVVFHIAIQIGFTAGVHGHFLAEDSPHPALASRPAGMLALLAAAVGIVAASVYRPPIAGLSGFEVVYRSFLAFYGLMIPAYALTCAWPIWRTSAPTRPSWWAFAITMACASPFYWLAFMERRYEFGLAGVAIVILGGVISNRIVKRTDPQLRQPLQDAPRRAADHF